MLRVWLEIVVGLVLGVWCARSSNAMPIYWINLDKNEDRRKAMDAHLNSLGLHHRRISALTPSTCNLLLIDNYCSTGLGVIGVLCSHVNALLEALHDPSPSAQASPYFVVLEDDVRFLYHVNFTRLVAQLPAKFGSVQLMLSHKLEVENNWQIYKSSLAQPGGARLLSHRERNASSWSAQAILYRKAAIERFVQYAVKTDRHGKRGFALSHSFEFDRYNPSDLNPFRPTIASKCLHADTFLYAMAQPSYALLLPMFSSSPHGLNSTLHGDHVQYHAHGFAAIQSITQEVETSPGLLPNFLKRIPHGQGSEVEVDWVAFAKRHPVSGKGIPKDFNF